MSLNEQWLISVLREEKKSFFLSIFKFFLFLLSLLYALAIKCRNALYDCKFLKSIKVPLKVISIGNVVAGGSGKTPFTLFLAKKLCQKKRVAILLRGYRSDAEKEEPTLVNEKHTYQEVGDEALLYKRNLPDAIVIVGKNRIKSSRLAQDLGAEILLLDDGMQYRKLFRDIEIVIKPPFESKYYLPRGFLRDDPKRAKKADCLVKSAINEKKVVDLQGNPWPKTIKQEKIALFSGIAYPQGFKNTVEQMGGQIVDEVFVPDHKRLSNKELLNFSIQAKEKGATLLLCTEKDSVKLANYESILPIATLIISVEVIEGKEFIERLVNE